MNKPKESRAKGPRVLAVYFRDEVTLRGLGPTANKRRHIENDVNPNVKIWADWGITPAGKGIDVYYEVKKEGKTKVKRAFVPLANVADIDYEEE